MFWNSLPRNLRDPSYADAVFGRSLKHFFSQSTSVHSASEAFTTMRYINWCFTNSLTYLLTNLWTLYFENEWTDFNANWHKSFPGATAWKVTGQGHRRPKLYLETWRMLQRIFNRANRRGFTVREYDLEALAETIYFITAVLQTTVWTTYTRQIENQQVPCSIDTEVTISPYLQYTSNLTKDISSLVYVLFDYVSCVSHVCFKILS